MLFPNRSAADELRPRPALAAEGTGAAARGPMVLPALSITSSAPCFNTRYPTTVHGGWVGLLSRYESAERSRRPAVGVRLVLGVRVAEGVREGPGDFPGVLNDAAGVDAVWVCDDGARIALLRTKGIGIPFAP